MENTNNQADKSNLQFTIYNLIFTMTRSTQTHTTSCSPDISIWLSVDPLSDKYPSLSPYNYCANNPIKYVDPDGMKVKPSNIEAHNSFGTLLKKYDKNLGYNNSLFQLNYKEEKGKGVTIGIQKNYNLKDFERNAKKIGYDLKSKEYREAETIFLILKNEEIIELAEVSINTFTQDTKKFSIETNNSSFNEFRNLFKVDNNGNPTNTPSQVQIDNFLKEGLINGNGFGFFECSKNDQNVKGILLINPLENVDNTFSIGINSRNSIDLILSGFQNILNE